MRAIFHLNADLDVVVQVEPGNSVVLGIREGVDYGDPPEPKHQPSILARPPEPQDRRIVEAIQELKNMNSGVRVKELKLSKSEARAIASALMACAAEL